MIAYIGIGANLGDARSNVLDAIERLNRAIATRVVRCSSLFRTAPIDSSGDDYINAVAQIDTQLDPVALLETVHEIELAHGRERPYRNAPRTLDLDILLYGDETVDLPQLHIPHPRMTERAFVLAPLLEIAPDIDIPGKGAAATYWSAVSIQGCERLP
jgi:2-amino-4-hydroxy-6-hydroxymethyldihydropteridine diphosphokinase